MKNENEKSLAFKELHALSLLAIWRTLAQGEQTAHRSGR